MQTKYKHIITELNTGFIKQEHFLDWLYNTCGPFKVQQHNYKGFASKWMDWLYARQTHYKDKVNHRTICGPEIVFDLDLPKWLTQDERKIILYSTLRRLKEQHSIIPVILDTGKGYHLHWFSMELQTEMNFSRNPKETKREYALKIISDIRSDMNKWNYNTMIAIECSRHWKRENKIELIGQLTKVLAPQHEVK